MEVETRCLEEAILEVVEVEEHVGGIQALLGITLGEVQATRSAYLNGRQERQGTPQKLALMLIVAAVSGTSALQSLEKSEVAQVGLQIAQSVTAGCQHRRHGQAAL